MASVFTEPITNNVLSSYLYNWLTFPTVMQFSIYIISFRNTRAVALLVEKRNRFSGPKFQTAADKGLNYTHSCDRPTYNVGFQLWPLSGSKSNYLYEKFAVFNWCVNCYTPRSPPAFCSCRK